MTRYFTDKVYRSMYWINGADKQRNEVINTIFSILNISDNNPKMPYAELKNKKKIRAFQHLSDCALFISGFGGLLNDKKKLTELGETLLKYGNTCFIIRTSSDDPEAFKELKTVGGLVFVPDYTVVSVKNIQGETINTLCIGGDITPDRIWRIKMKDKSSKFFNKFEYYKDEAPRFNEEAINDIIKDKDLRIDMVVSNIPISFVGTDPFSNSIKWLENDKTLKDDIISSRAVMDKVFMALKSNDKMPYVWFHTQPDVNRQCVLMGTKFTSTDSSFEYNNLFDFFATVIKGDKSVYSKKTSYIQRMIEEENDMNAHFQNNGLRQLRRNLGDYMPNVNPFDGGLDLEEDAQNVEEDISEDLPRGGAVEAIDDVWRLDTPADGVWGLNTSDDGGIPYTITATTLASSMPTAVTATAATTMPIMDYSNYFVNFDNRSV